MQAHLFSRMIDAALSVAPQEQQSIFKGALLVVKSANAALAATDGRRLVCVESLEAWSGVERNIRSVVSWNKLANLARLLDQVPSESTVALAQTSDRLHFQIGNRSLDCGNAGGWFPDYAHLLRGHRANSALLDRRNLQDALGSKSKLIRVSVRAGAIGLVTSMKGLERTETLPAEYQGVPAEFTIQSRHLFDALRMIPSDRVELLFDDSSQPLELRPVQSDDGLNRRFVLTQADL